MFLATDDPDGPIPEVVAGGGDGADVVRVSTAEREQCAVTTSGRGFEVVLQFAPLVARPEPKLGLLARPDSPPPVWLDRLRQDQKLCRSRRAAYHDLWYENSVAVTWLFPAFHACDEDLGRGDAHGVCRLCHR